MEWFPWVWAAVAFQVLMKRAHAREQELHRLAAAAYCPVRPDFEPTPQEIAAFDLACAESSPVELSIIDEMHRLQMRCRNDTGFMCLTDFQEELGSAAGGNTVYPSISDLKENRKCVEQCGIIEVRVVGVRIVQQSTG